MSGSGPVDPDLPVGVLMGRWPEAIPVFLRYRMLCVGCLVSPFHTLDDVCAEYGLDRGEFEAELLAAIADADQD